MTETMETMVASSSILNIQRSINKSILKIKRLEFLLNYCMNDDKRELQIYFASQMNPELRPQREISQQFPPGFPQDQFFMLMPSVIGEVNQTEKTRKEEDKKIEDKARSLFTEILIDYREEIISYVLFEERKKLEHLTDEFKKEIKSLNKKINSKR